MSYLIIGAGIMILILIGLFLVHFSRKACISQSRIINDVMPIYVNKMEARKASVIKAKPHVNRLYQLIEAYKRSRDPKILIEIGDLYRRGLYLVAKSNNTEAKRYYDLAAESDNKQIREIAQVKQAEAINGPIQAIDDDGDDIPQGVLFEILQTDDLLDGQAFARAEMPAMQTHTVTEDPLFMNDMQNVHDHYATNITKRNIDKLKELIPTRECDIKKTLKNALFHTQEFNDDQICEILLVLREFSNSNRQFDISETQALQLVYDFIQTQPNHDDLLHNLFLQLLDCREHGHIVCVTGKISRIVSVISMLDEFSDIKNVYYIKPELEQLASKIRDDVLAELSQDQIDQYNSGTGDSDAITQRMQNAYEQAVVNEYCVKLGINLDIIKPLIKANLPAF